MKWKVTFGLLIVCVLAVKMFTAENPGAIFQRALVQEQSVGNLKQAIELYERVAKEAGKDRALAAKALVRAAACYQKLGEPKATQIYQEVVRTYPEQRAQVTTAQMQLVSLRRVTPAQSPAGISPRLASDLSSLVAPLMTTYCIGCHSQSRKIGGFSLESVRDHLNGDTPNISQDAEILEKVIRRFQSRSMPPAGQKRPDEATYATTISLLGRALDAGYPQPVLPGDRATDLELASRLAKLIWNGGPDSALLDAANRGKLKDPAVIDQQVRRMLADPKSEGLVTALFDPWLHLPDLFAGKSTPATPPEFDEDLRQSLRRETQLFVSSQLREDRGAMELWTANYSFLNERLARHYGIRNVAGSQFRRVTWPDNSRAGLLGQGSVLAVNSLYAPREEAARTSPMLRGKWLLNTFFGYFGPPPPPSTPMLREDGKDGTNLRKRVEAYDDNPRCAGCHRMYDPLGFALENFDVIGRWRTEDGGEPVNPSGTFADGTTFSSPADFRNGLLQYREAFVSNVTEVLLSYALGRANRLSDGRVIPGRLLHPYEMPAVRQIVRESTGGYRWSSIIAGIAKSQPFQMKDLIP